MRDKFQTTIKPILAFILAAVIAFQLFLLGACANNTDNSGQTGATSGVAAGSGAAQSGGQDAVSTSVSKEIVIGTMITEDILPFWAAERDGIFAELGLSARVEAFQSAQELSTAMASGAVDLCMTDPMVAASLNLGGTPVNLLWVTLGTTPAQGRFGIMTSPESGITGLQDLAGKPIGVGSNTILEYVMDNLMLEAGIPADQIKSEEIKKIPVRYEMMTSNQVAAAALPNSLLVLGEATGMILIADDSKDSNGKNLSQSVMVTRSEFADSSDGIAALPLLQQAWDKAAELINNDPAAYRGLLAEKTLAALPQAVQDNYPVPEYPMATRPTAAMIDPILDWMSNKGYLSQKLAYNQTDGSFVSA